jgi:hypothetical protein
MYLRINGTNYAVTRRLVSSDTIKYLGVTPEPINVSGTIQMYRDDGFLMSSDNADNFSRKLVSGTLLQLTNKPEPDASSFVPIPTPPTAKVFTAVVG